MEQEYGYQKNRWLGVWLLLLFPFSLFGQSTFTMTPDPASGCGFLSVNFRNTTTPPPGTTLTGERWDFGDAVVIRGTVGGQVGDPLSASVNRIYTNPGQYNVTLTAYYNGVAQPISAAKVVSVLPQPTPVIRITNQLGTCAPITFQFDGSQSRGGNGSAITSYFWIFGDGRVSNEPNPTYTYNTPGTYNVTLRVVDANGCQQTTVISQPVVVGQGFNLQITSDKNPQERVSCSIPYDIQFNAAHGAGNYTYQWDFGDGNTSTLRNPSHTYTQQGNFNVSLTVRNLDNGCTVNRTLDNYVIISDFQPNFDIDLSDLTCPPAPVRFQNLSNIITDYQQVTWDFGDGTQITGRATATGIRNPTHVYTEPGTYNVTLTVNDTTSRNCDGTTTITGAVVVPEGIEANFNADRTGFCQLDANGNFTVNFQDQSTGAVSWLWDFGDGQTSTAQNPTHTYAGFGSYDVKLTVTNAAGCSSTLEVPNYVRARETVASFGAQAQGGCYPEFNTTLFDSTLAAVNITDWSWAITNDRTGTVLNASGPNPFITLTDTGTFSVTLRITTAEGCNSELTKPAFLRTGVRPTLMDFTASDSLICNNTNVNFTNLSTMPDNPYTTRWGWEYQDGAGVTDTTFNGSHLYDGSDPNPVTVTLYSFNNGCRDTLAIENILKIEPPKAAIDVYEVPCEVDSIFLTDASIGAQRVEWTITIGGVTTTTTERNPTIGVQPGVGWSAQMIAYNDDAREGLGCADTATVDGTQVPDNTPDFSTVTRSLLPEYTDICYPTGYQFDASGLTVPGRTITNFYWELGNNNIGTGPTPQTLYTQPGFYSVRLIVTTNDGCKYDSTWVDWIKVYGPVANIEVCDAGTCEDRLVSFRDISYSIAPIVSWAWDFGDGATSTEQNPQHTYNQTNQPQDRFYWVTLTVTDSVGCTDIDSVKVRPTHPFPVFETLGEPACDGENVAFLYVDSLSVGVRPFSARWSFSDGQTAAGLEPILFFRGSPTGITYEGTLILSDINGCQDSIKNTFTVFSDGIQPAFEPSAPVTDACPPLEVNFTDRSTILNPRIAPDGQPNRIVNWAWDFGDGNILEGIPNPTYVYTQPGTFSVSLTVFDAFGCDSTITYPDLVTVDGPQGTFTVSDTLGYPDLVVEVNALPEPPDANYDYTWDFGQGDFGTGKDTVFTYKNPGVYLLGLILDDGNCQYALPDKQRVEVLPCPILNQPPVVQCVSAGPVLLDVFDSATHTLRLGRINYEWVNGAGVVVARTASYTVPVPANLTAVVTDTFTVRVWIDQLSHNASGNADIKCADTLKVPVTFEPAPQGAFTYDISCTNLQNGNFSVDFTATSSNQGSAPVTYLWDFNSDNIYGNNPAERPTGLNYQAPNITYPFDSAGIYNIGLITRRDDNNCADTLIQTVYIPAVRFGVENACATQEVVFADSSIFDPALGVTAYAWDFGNGSTSTDSVTTRVYNTPGDYQVRLTVSFRLPNGSICSLSRVQTITIHPVPAQVPLQVADACVGTGTNLSYPVTGNIVGWGWDFNNDDVVDTVTTTGSIEFNFTTAGERTVRVAAVTDQNCVVEQTATFTINPTAVANFAAQNTCVGQVTRFTDLSTLDTTVIKGRITEWAFDFDGNGSFDQTFTSNNNLTHTYPAEGTFRVTMRVTTDKGCISTFARDVTIFPQPVADFRFVAACEGQPAQFFDQSNGNNRAIISYEWDFQSDGTFDATGTSPTFIFANAGTFNVTLRVTSVTGCFDEITQAVRINPAPEIEAGDAFYICEGESQTLTARSAANILFYDWSNGLGATASVTVNPSETTTYIVQAVDVNGCFGEDSVTVFVLKAPDLPADTVACEGSSITLDAGIGFTGPFNVNYRWNTGATTRTINVTQPGNYNVTVRYTNINNTPKECLFTSSTSVEFNPLPAPFDVDSLVFCFAQELPLELTYPGTATTVNWTNLSNNATFTGATIQIEEAGDYLVQAVSEFGCQVTDTVSIIEDCEPQIYFPTAFTPNSDGLNDVFLPKGRNFGKYELTIYNRWGEIVFYSNQPSAGWDGTFKGEKMPASLYPYILKYASLTSPEDEITQSGTVGLIR